MSLTRQQRRAQERAQLKADRRELARQTPAPHSPQGGPQTAAGKAASSQNATSHGLTAARLILPWENQAEFDALLSQLTAEHQPQTITEAMYVREMAEQWWRLQRARNEEYDARCRCARLNPSDVAAVDKAQKHLRLIDRYSTRHERAFHRCLNVLRTLQKERRLREAEQSARQPQPSAPAESVAQVSPQFVSQNAVEPQPETSPNVSSSLMGDGFDVSDQFRLGTV